MQSEENFLFVNRNNVTIHNHKKNINFSESSINNNNFIHPNNNKSENVSFEINNDKDYKIHENEINNQETPDIKKIYSLDNEHKRNEDTFIRFRSASLAPWVMNSSLEGECLHQSSFPINNRASCSSELYMPTILPDHTNFSQNEVTIKQVLFDRAISYETPSLPPAASSDDITFFHDDILTNNMKENNSKRFSRSAKSLGRNSSVSWKTAPSDIDDFDSILNYQALINCYSPMSNFTSLETTDTDTQKKTQKRSQSCLFHHILFNDFDRQIHINDNNNHHEHDNNNNNQNNCNINESSTVPNISLSSTEESTASPYLSNSLQQTKRHSAILSAVCESSFHKKWLAFCRRKSGTSVPSKHYFGSDDNSTEHIENTNNVSNKIPFIPINGSTLECRRPTHFVAIRINKPSIVEKVYNFQKSVLKKAPFLKPCIINPAKLHISVLILCLTDPEVPIAIAAVQRATEIFRQSRLKEYNEAIQTQQYGLKDVIQPDKKIMLDFSVVGTFETRVLFSTISDEQQKPVKALHEILVKFVKTAGLQVVGLEEEAAKNISTGATEQKIKSPEFFSKNYRQINNKFQSNCDINYTYPDSLTSKNSLFSLQDYEKKNVIDENKNDEHLYQPAWRSHVLYSIGKEEFLSREQPDTSKIVNQKCSPVSSVGTADGFYPHITIMKTSQGLRRLKNRRKKRLLRIDLQMFHEEVEKITSFGAQEAITVDFLEMTSQDPDGYYHRLASCSIAL